VQRLALFGSLGVLWLGMPGCGGGAGPARAGLVDAADEDADLAVRDAGAIARADTDLPEVGLDTGRASDDAGLRRDAGDGGREVADAAGADADATGEPADGGPSEDLARPEQDARTAADAGPDDDAGRADGGADASGRDDGGSLPDGGEVVPCVAGAPPEDLPARVIFRSPRTTYNARWYAALHEGRIWVKPNEERGEAPGPWTLLGSGLPEGGGLGRFPPPTEIVEISGDGTWLHAISAAGVFYRGTDFTGDIHSSFRWSDSWGHPAALGSGMEIEFPTTHGWAVSDSQRAGVHHYEDRLGTIHDVGMGVAHVYRSGPAGESLIFNDWWLPNDWSRQICLPRRGVFRVENLSASASTVFVVDAAGEMFTRLYDFDTSGENRTLEYSFLITAATGNVRALPAEDWRSQPPIVDGQITSRITIFQTGQGNAARTLRVEGVRQGKTGFFHKGITDAAWEFTETGLEVCGPFLDPARVADRPPVAPADFPLEGTLTRKDVTVGLRLLDFNIVCSPARALLLVNGQPATVAGQPLELAFHHVHTLTLERRPRDYWERGEPAVIRAALLVPETLDRIDAPEARQQVRDLFEDRRGVNFQGETTAAHMTLEEMTWLDPLVGVVPGNEKADPGNALALEARR
jgi:hypothetical protein